VTSYVIQGGGEGRERLRVLARVVAPGTQALFDRVGIARRAVCLDVGCGGGDVTLELARRVGSHGRALGVDTDETELAIARREADQAGAANVTFRAGNANDPVAEGLFDLVYARFLLTHVARPQRVIANMLAALRPGGAIVLEDIDFRGHFCQPPSAAFGRYIELYTAAVRRRGADPDIGPRLPGLLLEGGARAVQMQVTQPCGLDGEVKLLAEITMAAIAQSVIGAGLATAEEVKELIVELSRYARDPTTVMSLPRIVQSWGYKA